MKLANAAPMIFNEEILSIHRDKEVLATTKEDLSLRNQKEQQALKVTVFLLVSFSVFSKVAEITMDMFSILDEWNP